MGKNKRGGCFVTQVTDLAARSSLVISKHSRASVDRYKVSESARKAIGSSQIKSFALQEYDRFCWSNPCFEGYLGIDLENFERSEHFFGMLPSFQMICSAAWVFST